MYVFAGRDQCTYNLTGIPAAFERKSQVEFDPNEMKRLFALGEQMGAGGKSWIHSPWDELEH
jgi:hypothetical protein